MDKKEFIDQIEQSSGKEKCYAMLNYSRFLLKTDFDQGYKIANQALKIAQQFEDNKLLMSCYVHLAYASLYIGEHTEAVGYAKKVVELGKVEKEYRAVGTGFNILGSINMKIAKYSKATGYFLKSIDYYRKDNDQVELISCYNNLGMIHVNKSEYKEAKNYYQLALQIAYKFKSKNINLIRMNLANLLFTQGNYQEVKPVYHEIAKYLEENNMLRELASAWHNLGLTYLKLEDLNKSLIYNKKASALAEKIGDHNLKISPFVNIAEIYLKQNLPNEAKKYIDEGLKIAKKENNNDHYLQVYKIMTKYYELKKDLKSANKLLNKMMELQEIAYKENNDKLISELEAKHKTDIYRLKNSELDKKNKVMQSQLKELEDALVNLRSTHEKLKTDFEKAVIRINDQDNLLSSQSRMAIMGEMVSAITHQWRQPLNAISILTQSIQDAWDFDDFNQEYLYKQVELILNQVSYMNDTITDFRNFFKPDYTSEFYVSSVIDKALDITKYLLVKNNIEINKVIKKNCLIIGNPNELAQVLINIINNARQAMSRNNISNPFLRIEANCNQGNSFISLFNSGSPIKEDHLNKIFQPYFTTREKEGTGIGLHICKLIIINKFKGKISVKNHADGVEFFITIPIFHKDKKTDYSRTNRKKK